VPVWLEFPRSAQSALEQVFAACARHPGCHAAIPNLAQEFDELLRRLDEKPIRATVSSPGSTETKDVPIDAEVLRGFVASALYSAERIHDLPLLIHLAHSGDYQPLARRLASRGDGGIPKGVYLSIVCSDEIPQFDASALPAAAAGTFVGALRVSREILACREWVRGWLPEDYRRPLKSGVPALVLTGALDHIAPPRYGERVAHSFGNVRRLVLPNRGHNDTDSCVEGIEQAFIAAGDPAHLDTSCLAKTEDLSFAVQAGEMVD
jgi:pimeloyl-ACP methyl ester carboxylesterase